MTNERYPKVEAKDAAATIWLVGTWGDATVPPDPAYRGFALHMLNCATVADADSLVNDEQLHRMAIRRYGREMEEHAAGNMFANGLPTQLVVADGAAQPDSGAFDGYTGDNLPDGAAKGEVRRRTAEWNSPVLRRLE